MKRTNSIARIKFPSVPPIGMELERVSGDVWTLVALKPGEYPLQGRRQADGKVWSTKLEVDLTHHLYGAKRNGAV